MLYPSGDEPRLSEIELALPKGERRWAAGGHVQRPEEEGGEGVSR
jgi:hypothetical protein